MGDGVSEKTSVNVSSPILGLLGVMFIGLKLTGYFIGLKLTGYIDWSWWWVLAPFWGGFALVLLFLAIAGVIALTALKR